MREYSYVGGYQIEPAMLDRRKTCLELTTRAIEATSEAKVVFSWVNYLATARVATKGGFGSKSTACGRKANDTIGDSKEFPTEISTRGLR